MHSAAVYRPGQKRSFDDLPNEIQLRIFDFAISSQKVMVKVNDAESRYQGPQDRYPLLWTPLWVPALRLVSRTASEVSTIIIRLVAIPAVSVLPSAYSTAGAAAQTTLSIEPASIFPDLLTGEAKKAVVRDNYAAFFLKQHIEVDVSAFQKLKQLILGPIDIAIVAHLQVQMSRTLSDRNASLENLWTLIDRMHNQGRNLHGVGLVLLLKILPQILVNGFTRDVARMGVKALMKMWYDTARRNPEGYASVMRQVTGMIQLERGCITGLPADAEIVLEFCDCSTGWTTGFILCTPEGEMRAEAVHPETSAAHMTRDIWNTVKD